MHIAPSFDVKGFEQSRKANHTTKMNLLQDTDLKIPASWTKHGQEHRMTYT